MDDTADRADRAQVIGHITVDPPLGPGEIAYVTSLASGACRGGTRRSRGGDPQRTYQPLVLFDTRPAPPSDRCVWVPSKDGRHLTYRTGADVDLAAPWLRHLSDHILGPAHVLEGVVAAYRPDIARLWLVRVKENRVREQVLVAGSDLGAYGRRPAAGPTRRRAKRGGSELAEVIPLPVSGTRRARRR